jgi:hypothetical protein
MPEIIQLNIADCLLTIEFDRRDAAHRFTQKYANFLVTSGLPDVNLQLRHGQLPDVTGWEKVFEVDETWVLFRAPGHYALQRMSSGLETRIYQVSVFDQDFRSGEIHILGSTAADPLLGVEDYLLEHLFVNLLAQGQGVLLHAAVVDDSGVGRVFAGNSGAGKSTLSTLWQRSGHGRVLCDDRVVVRKRDGRFWAYGTPWHGTAGIAVPGSVPLDQLFILKQAGHNQSNPLRPLEAATHMFTRAFPTFWDSQGLAFTLDFLAAISQEVPCYELEFAPRPEVIDYVRCLKSP